MVYSECQREKLSQYKIERQSKPFIDQNLQLQLPGWDSHYHHVMEHSHSPIYAHYIDSTPAVSYFPLEVNETELYQAMQEAEGSYKFWLSMQKQLKEIVQVYRQ